MERVSVEQQNEELDDIDVQLVSIQIEIDEHIQRIKVLKEEKEQLLIRKNELLSNSSIRSDLSSFKFLKSSQPNSKSARDWENDTFEWTERAQDTLSSVFRMKSFRPFQRSCINATMARNDVILIMPTGGGKSLCYQLPAALSDGFSLVITPLISLMEDQLRAADKFGIVAKMLTGTSSKEDVKLVHSEMVSPECSLKLLYVTPEKIAKSKMFMNKLEKSYEKGLLSCIVIDEVHCTSQWGHDFRPDYKFLNVLKRQFKSVPFLGLTATATSRVLEDVKNILNIQSALVFKSTYNRPNLYYEVRKKPKDAKSLIEQIAKVIKEEFPNQCGIIYTLTKKDSDDVADRLKMQGIRAASYHADKSPTSRTDVHKKWFSGIVKVIVATIAFGMGIDKPDVRFVLHHTLSKSVENYYQESGRAGRDGQKAHCIIFYRPFDSFKQSVMNFQDMNGLRNLYSIIGYCHGNGECRRACLAKHFGDVWKQTDCDVMCDVCATAALQRESVDGTASAVQKSSLSLVDITDLLRSFIDVIRQASQRLTALKLFDGWNKQQTSKFSHFTSDTIEFAIVHGVLMEVLQEDFHFTPYSTCSYLKLGPKAPQLMAGKLSVQMPNPEVLQLLRKKAKRSSAPKPSDWVSTRIAEHGNSSLSGDKSEKKMSSAKVNYKSLSFTNSSSNRTSLGDSASRKRPPFEDSDDEFESTMSQLTSLRGKRKKESPVTLPQNADLSRVDASSSDLIILSDSD